MVQRIRCRHTFIGHMRALMAALPVLICVALIPPTRAIADSQDKTMLIDDFSRTDLVSALGTEWRGVSDRVMGGVSQESVSRSVEGDRPSLHLQGDLQYSIATSCFLAGREMLNDVERGDQDAMFR